MKIKTLVHLSLFAAAVTPALSVAQAVTTDHYSIRGFSQTTYLGGSGLGGMFTVNEATVVNGRPQQVLTAYGSAMGFLPGGRLVTYFSTSEEAIDGWVRPSNHSLKTPGAVEATFAARRMEYQVGPGGIQLISVVDGTITAGSTLYDATVVDRTFDNDHFTLTIPGIGMIFSVKGQYSGKMGFNPSGTGGMIFTPANGVPEVLFAPDTAVDPASWMGWLRTSTATVSRN